jgi:hypothetical protein
MLRLRTPGAESMIRGARWCEVVLQSKRRGAESGGRLNAGCESRPGVSSSGTAQETVATAEKRKRKRAAGCRRERSRQKREGCLGAGGRARDFVCKARGDRLAPAARACRRAARGMHLRRLVQVQALQWTAAVVGGWYSADGAVRVWGRAGRELWDMDEHRGRRLGKGAGSALGISSRS